MKLNKDERKKVEIKIKELLKAHGFKGPRGCMYKTDKKVYVSVLYSVVESKRLIINVHVKNYSYDNFFWRIMNMKENENQGDSFRASGAFVSPGIQIKKIIHEFTENYLEGLESLVDETVEYTKSFIQQNDINEYVFLHKDFDEGGGDLLDGNILKCLAYCDIKKVDDAKKIAKNMIASGYTGSFENEGKSFFEWMLLYEE